MNRKSVFSILCVILICLVLGRLPAWGKKKMSPFDLYDHKMHNALFESVKLNCEEVCHSDPASYGDRKKVNPLGCHRCHNSPNPIMQGPNDCTMCHPDGPPKPQSHKLNWMTKHQTVAKTDPKGCSDCHKNAMFCIDCHKRRDTVEQRVHKRNFKFFHSVVARANPRKCDACHTVTYCQNCHAGRGDSSK